MGGGRVITGAGLVDGRTLCVVFLSFLTRGGEGVPTRDSETEQISQRVSYFCCF